MKLTALPEVFDIPSERARQTQHDGRGRQIDEAEGDVPLPELLGIEPAAEQDAAAKADQPLGHGHHQQDGHAGGQRVGGAARRALGRGFGKFVDDEAHVATSTGSSSICVAVRSPIS